VLWSCYLHRYKEGWRDHQNGWWRLPLAQVGYYMERLFHGCARWRVVHMNLDDDGFMVLPNVMGAADLERLSAGLASLMASDSSPGIRDLAAKSMAVRMFISAPCIRELVMPVLGPHAVMVRSIFFNKNAEMNWQVAWHQDLSIAVRAKADVAGFGSWSVKEGIPHVQPPTALLEKMLTVRLHLDPADETNGALWVVPGSHRKGRFSAQGAANIANTAAQHLCAVHAGDAMLFRPLILHASRKAISDQPRRVIHLEFCAEPLPAPLAWWECIGVVS
jgi:hypothetical protein